MYGEERADQISSRMLLIKVRAKYYMLRSGLEINLNILKILAQKGPLKLVHIMHIANVNCDALKEYVKFLTRQGLIEKCLVEEERKVFMINQKGLTLLESWKELKQSLPAVENQTDEQLLLKNPISPSL
jgi:predicted transcriptional regulator